MHKRGLTVLMVQTILDVLNYKTLISFRPWTWFVTWKKNNIVLNKVKILSRKWEKRRRWSKVAPWQGWICNCQRFMEKLRLLRLNTFPAFISVLPPVGPNKKDILGGWKWIINLSFFFFFFYLGGCTLTFSNKFNWVLSLLSWHYGSNYFIFVTFN